MKKAIIGSLAALLCHVGTASAGVPAWCKEADPSLSFDMKDLSSQNIEMVVRTLAAATCKPTPESSAAAAQIEASRQAWGKKLLMNDADWADVIAYINASGNPDELQLSVKDVAAMTPLDQYKIIWDSQGGSSRDNTDYFADMFEPNLSEVGRFANLRSCVNYVPSWNAAVTYAQCQGDIDAFDRNKFAAQLRSDTAHPGANKMKLRFDLYALPKALKEHDARVKAIWAKDAAYKKLWDAAAKGRADWTAHMPDKDMIALAARMDSAYLYKSRKMLEGCEAPTEAALNKAIGDKVPASMFKDIKKDRPEAKYDYYDRSKEIERRAHNFGMTVAPALADIPELMFAIGPYIECHGKDDQRGYFLRGLLKLSPGFRGPRRAAYNAMLRATIQLDDMNAKIDYFGFDQLFSDAEMNGVGTTGGVVSSVKEVDGALVVSFAKEKMKAEDCIKMHQTNKVTRVNSDGSYSYELICDKYGMVEYDNTPADQRVSAVYKPLLKKGVQFTASGLAVIAIWPNKDAKLPSHILGVAVK